MAAVIDFARYDKRATHRIFSEPRALDLINDADALAQEGIVLAHNALSTRDVETKDRIIRQLGGKLVYLRRIAHEASTDAQMSEVIDLFGGDGAA